MILSKRSWWLKWAYLFDSKNRPTGIYGSPVEKANLCDVFWRSILGTPLLLISWCLFFTAVGIILWDFLKQVWHHKVETGIGVFLFGLFIFIMWLSDRKVFRKVGASISGSIVVEGVRAVKRKYCPIITLKE